MLFNIDGYIISNNTNENGDSTKNGNDEGTWIPLESMTSHFYQNLSAFILFVCRHCYLKLPATFQAFSSHHEPSNLPVAAELPNSSATLSDNFYKQVNSVFTLALLQRVSEPENGVRSVQQDKT